MDGKVSIAEMEKLQRENAELREQLDQVLATASKNEAIWRHFTEIERILFRTRQLDQLVEELLCEIKSRFEPDLVALFITHGEMLEEFFPEISRSVKPLAENTWILPPPNQGGPEWFGKSQKPSFLLSADVQNFLDLFPDDQLSSIESGIFIPLCVHKIHFGSLFLGSRNPYRFRAGDGTELLEQLGAKIALCMDNCLAYDKIKDLTIMDPLTGLYNYFQISTILEKEFKKARRKHAPLSVFLITLDFLHKADGRADLINGVLQHVTRLLQEAIPDEEGYVGRYGSDQFLVVLPGVPEEEAREVVPYLRKKILKSPFTYKNAAILIEARFGVGALSEHSKRSQDLLDAAYLGLCRQKAAQEKTGNQSVVDP